MFNLSLLTMEEAMKRSGLNNALSIFSGFRGPLDVRFKGTWYGYLYRIFCFFTDFLMVANTLTIGIHFFSPGVPLEERCACGFPMLTSLHSCFRTFYFAYFRSRFAKLMIAYDNSFKGDYYRDHLIQEIEDGSKLTRPFSKILLCFMVLPMIPWCFIPIVNEIYGLPRVLTIPAWFPMDLTKRTYFSTFFFALATMIQTLGANWVPMRVIAFDDVFYCYATRQLAMLRHLSYNFKHIFKPFHVSANGYASYNDYNGKPSSRSEVEKQMIRRLRQWVIHHQEAMSLMKELQTLYSPALMVQFSLLSLILCFNAFYVALADVDLIQVIFCALFVLGNTMELLITCRIGDYFIIQRHSFVSSFGSSTGFILVAFWSDFVSNEISDGIVGKNFYLSTKPEHTYLRMILTRCQVPLSMSAFGVFPLNTDTFQSIIVSAYSYFTMLKKMKSR